MMDPYEFMFTPHEKQKIPNQTKKRKKTHTISQNEDMWIQESLQGQEDEDDSITPCSLSLGGTVVPLPGFDDAMSCRLCQIRLHTDSTVMENRMTTNGATLIEFCQVAHDLFHDEGRPAHDVVQEIREKLKQYGQNCNIPFLMDLSQEEVFRHFKYDHARMKRVNRKEKMIRILDSMMDVCVSTCCEKMENGKTVLNKADASLVMNIIDRINRIQCMKE